MYDTICFKVQHYKVPNTDLLDEIPNYLIKTSTSIDDTTGCTKVKGYLGNLFVSITDYQVSIQDSLCKWYLGDNVQTMTRADVQGAIESLSDALHLPIELADVTRLDTGTNFAMNHPCKVYYDRLSELSRYARLLQPNGIRYQQSAKSLCVYDKRKELASHKPKSPLPENLPEHLLRCEFRVTTKRAMPKVYGQAVTGTDLYQAEFYNKALQVWKERYYAIRKINDVSIDFENMTGLKELNRMSLAFMVQELGYDRVLGEIDLSQRKGELSKMQASRMRKAIHDANSIQCGVTITNTDIAELNAKVDEAVEQFTC